uniref:Uncharacterized protein n=1 Tax=Zea mays TaxID=4577 RepID=C0P435_MAIZE|nr:unknown [Zea mays]
MRSQPERAGVLEQRHEGAVDVRGHDAVHGADQPAADEHDGHDRRARRRGSGGAEEAGQGALQLAAPRVVVQLVHRRVHAHAAEEALHGVAHAAGAHAEHHHRALRRQPLHALRRRLHGRRRCHHRHVRPRLLRRRRAVLHCRGLYLDAYATAEC